MTKTKRQLRAEAVERLKQLDEHNDYEDIVEVMVPEGVTVNRTNWAVELDTIIDLLTDDCGPCYSCAKLAELRAENSQLRGIVGDLKVPTAPGEASMMSVNAFIKKQTEHESLDTREKLEADARALQTRIWQAGANSDGISLSHIIELLDRQAAITKREREQHWLEIVGASANCNLELTNQIAELHEDVAERDDVIAVLKVENAELTAELERDTLSACNTCATRIDMQEKLEKIREIAS